VASVLKEACSRCMHALQQLNKAMAGLAGARAGAAAKRLDRDVSEHLATTNWATHLDPESPRPIVTKPCPDFDEVYHFKGLLTPGEAGALVTASEEEGYGCTNYPKHYRGNLRLINDDPKLAAALYSRILPAVPPEIRDDVDPSLVWRPCGLNNRFRCSKCVECLPREAVARACVCVCVCVCVRVVCPNNHTRIVRPSSHVFADMVGASETRVQVAIITLHHAAPCYTHHHCRTHSGVLPWLHRRLWCISPR